MAAEPRASSRHRVPLLLLVLIGAPLATYLAYSLAQAGQVSFKRPWALLLVGGAALAYWVLVGRRGSRVATLAYSGGGLLARLRQGLVARVASLPAVLRVLVVALLALALARPQTRDRGGRVEVEGIDIALVLDMSNSMEATDLMPNRLEAAKRVVDEFISRRKSDRIGVVVFGKEAFTFCPLTLDYSVLRGMLSELQLGHIDGTATAIGNALGVALARLRKSDAKTRVAILLTDGDSNAGNVSPAQAARYAAAMGVKVFTILMGPKEGDVMAGRDWLGRPIQIARQYPVNPKLLE